MCRTRLPEVDPGSRRRPFGISSSLPVVYEVVPSTVAGVHPDDEVEQNTRPRTECVVARGIPEPVQEHAAAGRIIHTRNALHTALAGLEMFARRTGVNGECQCARPGSRHWPRQGGQLPQQCAREAPIAFTSKEAAAIRESAAP